MRRAWISAGALALAAACSDPELQVKDEIDIQVVDNLLEIEGTLCTDPPEATDFPVKILFIIDGSGSMQFVDQPNRRALAVEEAILRLRANPSVSFGVIRFNESDAVLTKPGTDINAGDPFGVDLSGAFTRDFDILSQAVQGLRVADSVTDYQGALSSAFLVLSQDMLASPPAQLARTKYVVLFLSDGDPFPTCCSQESQDAGICTRDTNIFFCEDPDAIRQNPTQLPFLEASTDYNQNYQIYNVVQDIQELGANFGVGELRMHTAFLFDPTLVDSLDPATGCYVIGGVNFVCPDRARELLGTMADIGQGVFRDFSTAEEIDFLGFDLTTIKRENALKNLIVTNSNVLATSNGIQVDSDGDGLSDTEEFEDTLNRTVRDTDDDGFSDPVEFRFARAGLDPISPNPGCETEDDRRDIDFDGLSACEELLLRTSTELYDTDADGVPDGLEVVFGTRPNESDNLADADLDGRRNGDEIRFHTSVGFNEAGDRSELAYRYRTSEAGFDERGGRCYDFIVENVQLMTPLARPGESGSFARNDIYVYMAQAPRDDPSDFGSFRVACVQGRYVAPDFKDPPGGLVQLKPDDFKDPAELDPEVDCVGLDGTALLDERFPPADPGNP
jgi:hypothetical protein